MKLPELLATAEARGELTPEESARIGEFCERDAIREGMPWYLHAVVTVGAWFAASFLLGFLFAILGRSLEHGGAAVIGLLLIIGATAFARMSRGVFVGQICLALSVAGHGLLFHGVDEASDRAGAGHQVLLTLTLVSATMAGVLYFLYPDPLHRFLSSLTALFFTTAWTLDRSMGGAGIFTHHGVTNGWWLGGSILLHLALLWLIFGRAGARLVLRPFGYAVAVSLVGLFLLAPIITGLLKQPVALPHRVLSVAVGLATLLSAGGGHRAGRNRQVWLVLALALVALAYTSGPETLTALLFLVLGFGLQDRALLVLGTLLLPGFLFLHYYFMAETLLHKSVMLMASGVVLLLLRAGLQRVRWEEAPAP